MTYGVFGWLYASWVMKMIEDEAILNRLLETQTTLAILYGVGTIWILLIAIIFTAPVALMKISLIELMLCYSMVGLTGTYL